jgi:hypothetical protein
MCTASIFLAWDKEVTSQGRCRVKKHLAVLLVIPFCLVLPFCVPVTIVQEKYDIFIVHS